MSEISLSDPAAWIKTVIQKFIENSPENTLKNQENDKAFENPLVGFSSGDDPLYDSFKEYVRQVFKAIGSGDAFILGVADNVMPDSLIDRIEWISERVESRCGYPMSVNFAP